MNGHLDVYHRPGRLGMGLVLVPPVAIVAALGLGVAYSYANVYIPYAYVSVALVLALGAGVGFAISRTALATKCTSAPFVVLVALGAGLLAVYTAWAAFAYALSRRDDPSFEISLIDIFHQPGHLWEFVKLVGEAGWYSIDDSQVRGTTLWVFWTLEALTVIGTSTAVAVTGLFSRVLCDRCEKWCRSVKNKVRLAVPDDTDLLEDIAAGDIAALEQLPVVPSDAVPALRIDQHVCEKCDETATMQVKFVTLTQKKDGKWQIQEQDLTPRYVLPREANQRLEELSQRPPIEVPDPFDEDEDDSAHLAEGHPQDDCGPHDTGA